MSHGTQIIELAFGALIVLLLWPRKHHKKKDH